jgi:hypothetical protein
VATATNEEETVNGIIIAFSRPIDFGRSFMNGAYRDDHIFQVLVQLNALAPGGQGIASQLTLRGAAPGRVAPVEPLNGGLFQPNQLITAARLVPQPASGKWTAPAVAFVFEQKFAFHLIPHGASEQPNLREASTQRNPTLHELWILLRGDFVIDATEKGKAIDAEFVRAELPTGNRQPPIDVGIQGGLFESWGWMGAGRIP